MSQRVIHNQAEIQQQITRLAHELMAGNGVAPALIGIQTNGVPLAARLADAIAAAGHKRPDSGFIDITLYRDDLAGKALPSVRGSSIEFDLEGRRVVLVDDVLFTGRTVRAALTELSDYGRPSRIELCVLVDRGHRELPVCADYTGLTVESGRDDRVKVLLKESGAAEDSVVLIKRD